MITISTCIDSIKKIINDYTAEGVDDNFDSDVDGVLTTFITTASHHIATIVHPELVAVSETKEYTVQDNLRPDGKFYKIIQDIAFRKLISLTATFTKTQQETKPQETKPQETIQWTKVITDFQPFSSPAYKAQFTDVPGIGNGPKSPAVFMTPGVAGANTVNPTIEIHAFDQDTTLSVNVTYIPVSLISTDNTTININQALSDALCHMAAALYLQSIADERAQIMMATANSLLQPFTPITTVQQ